MFAVILQLLCVAFVVAFVVCDRRNKFNIEIACLEGIKILFPVTTAGSVEGVCGELLCRDRRQQARGWQRAGSELLPGFAEDLGCNDDRLDTIFLAAELRNTDSATAGIEKRTACVRKLCVGND